MLEANDGLCALCNAPVLWKDAVLDHSHKSGHVRGVLHSDCNVLLGKVENYIQTRGKAIVKERRIWNALALMYNYMYANYSTLPLHPKHLTPLDKELRKARRGLRLSKKDETKEKYRNLIKELKIKLEKEYE